MTRIEPWRISMANLPRSLSLVNPLIIKVRDCCGLDTAGLRSPFVGASGGAASYKHARAALRKIHGSSSMGITGLKRLPYSSDGPMEV